MCQVTQQDGGENILACFRPNAVLYSDFGGLPKFVGRYTDFGEAQYGSLYMPVPCQKCAGCRLDYSKKWADRMLLEYHTEYPDIKYQKALFLTMTYDDKHLPMSPSCWGPPLPTLNRKHVQLFNKKLRQYFWRTYHLKLRMYYAAEYGDLTARPHYHMILYGAEPSDFPDYYIYSEPGGVPMYESPKLNSIWERGEIKFAVANYQTFCYVARYVIKKQFYRNNSYKTWEGREPPFNGISLGLGANYFVQKMPDCDRVTLYDGQAVHDIPLPRIVLDRIKRYDPAAYDDIMSVRRSINQGKSDLLMTQIDKPYTIHLHDQERKFIQTHNCLKWRRKI